MISAAVAGETESLPQLLPDLVDFALAPTWGRSGRPSWHGNLRLPSDPE